MIKVKILTSDVDIIRGIMEQLTETMNRVLSSAIYAVQNRILDRIEELILDAPEVDALANGDLGRELGLTDVTNFIHEMVARIQGSIKFTIDRVGYVGERFTSGGYKIEILRSDFSDILSLDGASYITTNGKDIPWLNWLLFAGSTPVIYGYRIEYDPRGTVNSRTGVIMVRDPGGSWGVPSQYAGVADDNFLTRALIPLENDIDTIIKEEIGRAI